MTQTKINVPEGFMLNARGGLDPVAIVKDIDKLRDDMVHEIVNESIQKHKELQEMKKRFFSTIDAFVRLSAEKYNLNYGGKKGNMTFLSYDGMYKVVVSVNENIFFDERLQIAKGEKVQYALPAGQIGFDEEDSFGLPTISGIELNTYRFRTSKDGKFYLLHKGFPTAIPVASVTVDQPKTPAQQMAYDNMMAQTQKAFEEYYATIEAEME